MKKTADKILEWSVVILLIIMLGSVLWGVGTRYLLNDQSSWTAELARFALIWLSITGATYVAGKNGHIAIDLLPSYLSEKNQYKLEVVTSVIIALFVLCIFIIGGARYVYVSLYLGQTSAALGIPMGYIYLILPVCGLFIIYYKILHIRKAINQLKEI